MLGWGPASFVALFVLPFRRLVMCASVGLRIEGRPAEVSMSRRNGDGLDGLIVAVAGVLPVGYLPPPSKGKGKISEIRYPGGSEYLRIVVRYADAMGPSRVEPSFTKFLLLVMDPLLVSESGVLISSRLMWCPFQRWSASLRRPLRMVFDFLCTPS